MQPGGSDMARTARLDETELFKELPDDKPKPWHQGIHIPLLGWFPRMNREKSLYAILITAAAIDSSLDDRELTEIHALAERTKTLRHLSRASLDKMHESLEKHLEDEKKVNKLAERATRRFRGASARRKASAYMHALDIMFADQQLTETEKAHIKNLAKLLRIPANEALDYVNVMMNKNAN